jgi:NitT/TauT family transport system substrate-binding protein
MRFGFLLNRRASSMGRFACALAGAALMIAQGAGPAAAAEEVRLNEVLRSLFYTPQYVAFKIGAFEQEGLKIVGPKTTWGSQAALTEIVSGNSDVALLGPEAAALTQEASPERRLVNFAQLTNGDGSFIMAKKPIPKFSIADLKGKTIVTSGKGATPALVLVHLVKQAGLDPNKDVTVRNIPQSSNIIPSYLEPSTEFAQAFEPMITQAIAENKGHRVASVHQLMGPLPYTAFMASASYIEKNPDTIQAFTNAVYKALLWTETHSAAEIADLIGPEYFKNVSPETIKTVIEQYKKIKIWATEPLITPDGMNRMKDLLVEGGILKARVPYDRIVNPTFAKKAMQTINR